MASWAYLKSFVDLWGIAPAIRYTPKEGSVYKRVWVNFDGTIVGVNSLSGADLTDFETNYKPLIRSGLDQEGAFLSRSKATMVGWHFQMHAIQISTATINGARSKSINPVTLVETDTGFVTYKVYRADRTEIVAPDETTIQEATFTVVDWCVNHNMEIVGALVSQSNPPASDVWMYTCAAPGIANIPFGTGGINMKNIGQGGSIDADGKAAKFLSPTLPVPGVNKFRTILSHNAGVAHTFQLVYKLFKP